MNCVTGVLILRTVSLVCSFYELCHWCVHFMNCVTGVLILRTVSLYYTALTSFVQVQKRFLKGVRMYCGNSHPEGSTGCIMVHGVSSRLDTSAWFKLHNSAACTFNTLI